MSFPTNVLHLATECSNKSHSAVFPESLPEWFIKLFTKTDDLVLDPFSGSGTTMRVARNSHRKSIGIELMNEYCEICVTDLNLVKSEDGIYESA